MYTVTMERWASLGMYWISIAVAICAFEFDIKRKVNSGLVHNSRQEKRWVSLHFNAFQTDSSHGTHAPYAAFFTNPLYPTYKNV